MSLPEIPTNTLSDEKIMAPTKLSPESVAPMSRTASTTKSVVKLLVALTLFFVLLAMVVTWMGGTQAGTQTTFKLAQWLSGGALKTSGLSGRLADEIRIDELTYQNQKTKLRASGVKLIWRPRALIFGQLNVETLEMSSLHIASAADPTPAQLPADLRLPVTVKVSHAALGRLSIFTLQNDGSELPTLTLSAITAQLDSSQLQHALKGELTSPWGRLQLQGQIASAQPFALQGTFNYHGQANKAIPSLGVSGHFQGSLAQLSISAKANTEAGGETTPLAATTAVPQLQGGFSAMIMAFSAQPLRALQANIDGLNPADFFADAPKANLQVRANLHAQTSPALLASQANKITLQQTMPTPTQNSLAGRIEIENTKPGRIDQNALPILSLQSDLQWSDSVILLKNTIMLLSGNGKITGQANINLPAIGLPLVDSHFNLSGINLAQIDRRIQPTKIAGTIHADTSIVNDAQQRASTLLRFQAQLNDPRASLAVEANYQITGDETDKNNSSLHLSRFELSAADSRMLGKGEINFSEQKKFNFQGELKKFDPSRWLTTPAGHIDTEIVLSGQILPKLLLNLQLPRLEGDYAGQAISGVVDATWQQDMALSVRKLNVHWGKNRVDAIGVLGRGNEGLTLNLDAPNMSAFSPLLDLKLTGSMQAEAHLTGTLAKPAGKLRLSSQAIGVEKQIELDDLSATFDVGSEQNDAFNADVVVHGVRANMTQPDKNRQITAHADNQVLEQNKSTKMPLLAQQMSLSIKGNRDAHLIEMNARLTAARQFALSASGSLKPASGQDLQWSGQVARLSLNGKQDIKLLAPMQIDATASNVHLGRAQFSSSLGKIILEQFEWMPGNIKTRGQMSDVKLIDVVNLIKPQYAVEGDLLVNADWDLQLKDNVRGALHLRRQSGDIRVNDVDGTGQALPLGMSDLQLALSLGGLVTGTDTERVAVDLTATGARLGNWRFKSNSQLRKTAEQWTLPSDAALAGELQAEVSDLQWLGPWINPGLALKGKLKVDATLKGTIGAPQYLAQIEGRELEVAFASEGILLPNGSLSAVIDESHLKLNQLQFSNKVSVMPKHTKFRDLNWVGQTGEFHASGEIDIAKQSGNIQAQFQKFPLLQRKDRWLVVSGDTSITENSKVWALTGKLIADGAYFKLPKSPPPSLSSDVVVTRSSKKTAPPENTQERSADAGKKGLKTRLDVTLDMGPQFVFVGSGLDTTLTGTVRLRSNDGSPLQASGTIRTEDGIYEGYGQKLAIERGILTFQGSPGNPGLNILALRKGLEVEAGVEVSGTVSSSQVRLVSEPSVPDAEKLSWLVLGTGTADIASNQTSVLMSAAGAIFGDDNGRNIPRDIVQGLGFDEFSVGAAENAGSSKLPGQTVAGATAVGSSSGDQVVSIGKRLRPGLVLSVERGLSDASGALKLSWQLTRRISIIGRKGTEGSVDVYYTFSFH